MNKPKTASFSDLVFSVHLPAFINSETNLGVTLDNFG
jgi:hypothetical protein